eukprot:jgi/Mesvir1/17799/Mv12904-RA.1
MASAVAVSAPTFVTGLGAKTIPSRAQKQGLTVMKSKKVVKAMGARADYLGSSTNVIMIASTAAFLAAGRFGLAPSTQRPANAACKLQERDIGIQSNDPAGFNWVDTLAHGACGHIFGVGLVLGLRATGNL